MTSTKSFYAGAGPARGRRLALAVAAVAAAAVAVATATRVLGSESTGSDRGRLIVAVDATVQLSEQERAALLERRVVQSFAHDGALVAVYAFGADGSEADELIPFTGRAACQGPSCKSMWTADARQIADIAAQATESDATGSGVLEATCALPTRPGDTLVLVSDLTQRTASLDLTGGNFGPDRVDAALSTARDAGLICPRLRGVHLVVVGFGSDGRSGTQAAGLEAFWRHVAKEAQVASIDIDRFSG